MDCGSCCGDRSGKRGNCLLFCYDLMVMVKTQHRIPICLHVVQELLCRYGVYMDRKSDSHIAWVAYLLN